MTIFFSVDVEATDTRIGHPDTHLLTIGVVPVNVPDFGMLGLTGTEFYVRLQLSHLPARLFAAYWKVNNGVALGPEDHLTETMAWWAEQNEDVRAEAFSGDLVRHDPTIAARMLREFVIETAGDSEPVFVANPVAYDKPLIDTLFSRTGVENPFHYRSLCLRSMRFGLEAQSEWGKARGSDNKPTTPHHALSDAKAQALDLIGLLTIRDGPKSA